MLDVEEFGKNLYNERGKKGITQEELSSLLSNQNEKGISVQTLSGYEQPKGKKPSLKNAVAISNALGISLDYLCGGSSREKQTSDANEPQIDNLADLQVIIDCLDKILNSDKVLRCDEGIEHFVIDVEGDNIFLQIYNCPQLAGYYKDRSTMKDLLTKRTITKDIFKIWEDGATKNLKTTAIEDYEMPF